MGKMNKNNVYGNANYDTDVIKIVKIVACVIVFLLVVYLATALATGEISFKKNSTTNKETTIQYEEIIAGEVLNRSDKEYYVLLLNYTDDYATSILALKDNYESMDNSLKVYLVDIDKSFNSSILATDESYEEKPKAIEELKVKTGMTLLKVKDGKVTKRVESYSSIKEYINSLMK